MNPKSKLSQLLKNFSYSLASNLVSLVISTLVVLIIPKYIDVQSYGYWQLFVFYSTYVGLLHFGWNDGIYLREGGQNYSALNRNTYFSQFYLLIFSQLGLAVLICIFTFWFTTDANKAFVLYNTATCMVIVNCRYMLLFLLQATNRIKDYSAITILDRAIYAIFLAILLLFKIYDFKLMIYVDLLGKGLSFMYAMFLCKDIVYRRFSAFKPHYYEICENIGSGIKLMFSNIASKLIIGNIRFGIERMWSVVVFGQVSLTLSISGFMMLFINAVGIVLYPFLRNVEQENLGRFYLIARTILVFAMISFLFLYFPIIYLLEKWLPNYETGLKYLSILFPMCLFEGKMSMLVSTYLKVLREEKFLLVINLISLFTSFIVGGVTIYLLKNLDFTVLGIIFLVAVRCIIAELFITNRLGIKVFKSIIEEILITSAFIYICWFYSIFYAFWLFALVFSIFMLSNRKSLIKTILVLKGYFK